MSSVCRYWYVVTVAFKRYPKNNNKGWTRPSMVPRILLIDSDNELLAITKELLKKDGYSVMTMEDITERFMTLQSRRRIDCIVVDIDIPSFRTSQDKSTFKSSLKFYKCPIVIYTACKDDSYLKFMEDIRAEMRIQNVKKTKPDELLRVVRKAIEEYESTRLITGEELDEMYDWGKFMRRIFISFIRGKLIKAL